MTTLLIGTYTVNTKSEGIYLIKTDSTNNEILKSQYITAENPSFLTYLSSKKILYFVEELGDNKGRVKALKLNPETWDTELISDFSTGGSAPCHIAISPDEDRLIISNYMSGDFSCFALKPDGRIEKRLSQYQFNGKSIHPTRQLQSHIHSAFYSPDSATIFVQDLGADSIYQFKSDAIDKNGQDYLTHATLPGAGPRHLAFSKSSKAYLLNELNGCIDILSLDKKHRIKEVIQRISLNAPQESEVLNQAAQIRLSNDERFVYASNRGDRNQLTVYAVQENGQLEQIQIISAQGNGPRHFEFSTNQDFIYVANQRSDSIQRFTRNKVSGLLKYDGIQFSIPSPVFIATI